MSSFPSVSSHTRRTQSRRVQFVFFPARGVVWRHPGYVLQREDNRTAYFLLVRQFFVSYWNWSNISGIKEKTQGCGISDKKCTACRLLYFTNGRVEIWHIFHIEMYERTDFAFMSQSLGRTFLRLRSYCLRTKGFERIPHDRQLYKAPSP